MYKTFFVLQHWTRTFSLPKLHVHTQIQHTWQNTTLRYSTLDKTQHSDTAHLTKHNTQKRETTMPRWDSNL